MRLLSDLVASANTTKQWIYFECHYYITATDVRAGHVIKKILWVGKQETSWVTGRIMANLHSKTQ
jgi:hypothetical protein